MINRVNLFFVLLIVGWVVVTFSSALNAPFYLDDFDSILNHVVLRNSPSWQTISNVFTFREITYFSFAQNLQWWGDDATGFRWINLILHLFNGALTYVFVRLLVTQFSSNISAKRIHYAAVFASLLFLVLPLNSQAVIYIVQRGVLLAYLFSLLAMLSYIKLRFSHHNSYLKLVYAFVFVGAIVGGFMSKQNFVTVFLALGILEATHSKGLLKKHLASTILLFALAFPALMLVDFLLGLNIQQKLAAFTNTTAITHWQYFTHQLTVLWIYIYKFFVPYPLLLEYEPVLYNWSDSVTWFALLGHIGVITFALVVRNKAPIVTFAVLLYYGLHLVESSGLIVLDDLAFEHRSYLPNLALTLIVAYYLATSRLASRYLFTLCFGVILIFSMLTFQRGELWSKKLEFYRHELSHTFKNPRAYSAVGLYYAERGRLIKAEKWMQMALQVSEEIGQVEAGTITAYIKVLYDNGKIASANRFAAIVLGKTKSRKIKARIFIVMAEQKINQGYCNMAEGLILRAEKLDPENGATPLLREACNL